MLVPWSQCLTSMCLLCLRMIQWPFLEWLHGVPELKSSTHCPKTCTLGPMMDRWNCPGWSCPSTMGMNTSQEAKDEFKIFHCRNYPQGTSVNSLEVVWKAFQQGDGRWYQLGSGLSLESFGWRHEIILRPRRDQRRVHVLPAAAQISEYAVCNSHSQFSVS